MALLPVSRATLASDARVLATVRAIGERRGVDYTDDAAVSELLAERRRALEATQHGPLVWVGGLTLVAGVLWPFMAQMVPALSGRLPLSYAPAGPLLVVAVATLSAVRLRWKRELVHGTLVGYREVIGVARAHGLPVTHVPAWLEGRSYGGTGKGSAPVPTYSVVREEDGGTLPPGPAAPSATWAAPDPSSVSPGAAPRPPTRSASSDRPPSRTSVPLPAEPVPLPAEPVPLPANPAPIPPKPAAVLSYEQIAGEGGWHDEGGCLLLFGGLLGAAWGVSQDMPVAVVGALVLVPLAVRVWVLGSRQGMEKARLRQEALAYVRTIAAAQAAGAQVPELSPVLRKLLEEEEGAPGGK
ncbi:hypothetical protein [Streptomyces sp. NPDC060002]|uniref:hypothetical protein n=1 Tax=Streptomyces sp. NPDC060002 TaxID=3347033 RepID=UPI0036CE1AAE